MLALFCCATFLWFLMKKHFELTLFILAQDAPSERGRVKSFESKVKIFYFYSPTSQNTSEYSVMLNVTVYLDQ